MSDYATRGGHAPGHLRSMFLEYLETGEVPLEELYDPAEAGDWPDRWLFEQLMACTDILPAYVCDQFGLDLPPGSTYAMAVGQLFPRVMER